MKKKKDGELRPTISLADGWMISYARLMEVSMRWRTKWEVYVQEWRESMILLNEIYFLKIFFSYPV